MPRHFAALTLAGLFCSTLLVAQSGSHPTTDAGTVRSYREANSVVTLVPLALDTVWSALKSSLADLDIPIQEEDLVKHDLAARRFKRVHTWGKKALSSLFGCGSGLTGPNADSYHIFISYVISVRREGTSGTKIVTYMDADAVNVPEGKSDRVACESTGAMEEAIRQKLASKLGVK